jgi:hypothetical protein
MVLPEYFVRLPCILCRYEECLQDCAVAIYAQDDCKSAHLHKASALVGDEASVKWCIFQMSVLNLVGAVLAFLTVFSFAA